MRYGRHLSPAQLRVLGLLAQHGKAIRVRSRGSYYTWRINDQPYSGPVDSLFLKGMVELQGSDRDTAYLSARGLSVLGAFSEAA